jgi:hypothetical protein
MAAEVDLAAGNLAGPPPTPSARRLPFYRDEDHRGHVPAPARRRRWPAGTTTCPFGRALPCRLGAGRRPVAPNLARAPYAVAMVYGMRGDDERRAAWIRLTVDLGRRRRRLAGHRGGWPAVFDGLLALIATTRPRPSSGSRSTPTIPAVRYVGSGRGDLVRRAVGGGRRAGPPPRRGRARGAGPACRPRQPDRGRDRRARRRDRHRRPIGAGPLTAAFAELGCPYQQARTGRFSGPGRR